jgi:uncharacterized phiE125 gp8 family phage protein
VVKVITPPANEPVSLDEFKAWMQGLPITTEQEPMVNSLLKAGREEAEAYQNAAYCEQILQLTVEPEPHQKVITLPRPPFRELQNVTVILPDGTQQDMTSKFEVHNDGGSAILAPKPGENVPAFCRLQITYTAGYDSGAVPETVKQAILLYATWAWMHRGGDSTVPAAFYALLSKGRVIPV